MSLFCLLTSLPYIAQGSLVNYPSDTDGPLCNQHALLCPRAFTDISFLATRSSFAVAGSDNSSQPATQNKDIKTQLDDGVRALNFNLFPDPAGSSSVHVCFPDCTVIDGGSLDAKLHTVASWMNANPRDVITILLENTGGVAAAPVKTAFDNANLSSIALTTDVTTGWPTLGEMISNNQRLVVYGDKGDIVSGTIPWLLNYDNHLRVTGMTNITDKSWNCYVSGDMGTRNTLLIPHYFTESATVNGKQYDNMLLSIQYR